MLTNLTSNFVAVEEINYTLRQSPRARHLRITVNCDASVVVTTPFFFSQNKLEHFLREKSDWIRKKVEYFRRAGEGARLVPRGKRSYREYKEPAREFVHQKLTELNQHYHFSFNRVAIKNHSSRWGSCSRQKNLNFNYRILFLSKELAEYVVAHELCHLAEMNHSKKFWALVASAVPDFKERRKKLRLVRSS